MDAANLKKAAELSVQIETAQAALANIDKYCTDLASPATGRFEVCVPATANRPPNEPQTIDTASLTKDESDALIAFMKGLFQKRVTDLNAQIAAL